MSATVFIFMIAGWLALQIPIGMALGWYIRRARTAIPAVRSRRTYPAPRNKRRVVGCGPAVLLRG
jgi:hypothetical protein